MKSLARWAAAILVLAAAFAPALVRHASVARRPLVFNDDARQQVFPFFRYATDSPVGQDVLGDYQLDLIPPGYRALYQWSAGAIDPTALSKLLPYVLLAVLIGALARAAWILGGGWGAFLTLILTLGSSVFVERMIGGLPRAFAFPVIAVGLAAILAGRPWAIAVACVVAAWTYPPAGMLLCIALLLFLALPKADRGRAADWSFTRRTALVALVALAAAVPAVVVARDSARWGPRLGPGDAVSFPEAGSYGRYDPADMIPLDRNPLPDLWLEATRHLQRTLRSDTPWFPLLQRLVGDRPWFSRATVILVIVGIVVLTRGQGAGRRAGVLPAAMAIAFVLSTVAAPLFHLPQRIIAYSVPILGVVILPAGCIALLGTARSPHRAPIGAVLFVLLLVVVSGGSMSSRAGYSHSVTHGSRTLAFIGALPPSSLVAGWPQGLLDDVPYVSRRRVFMNWENHQVFSKGYALEMRLRMAAVLEALFGEDPSGLLALRDSAGVTHVVLDSAVFRQAPSYFAPFDSIIQRQWDRGRAAGFATLRIGDTIGVFREGDFVVLDLSRLP